MEKNWPQLLTPKEASQLLQITEGSLAVWRSSKRYPLRYLKIGGKIRYDLADILSFIQQQQK